MRKKRAGAMALLLAATLTIEGQGTVVLAQENFQMETIQEISVKGAAKSTGAQLNFNNVTAVFNVKDYGADTSVADNSRAFQSAFNAAGEYQESHAGQQCKVIIPPGKYKIARRMILHNNTWVSAKGATMSRTGNTNFIWNLAGSGYNGLQNVLIEGGTWDGRGATSKNQNALFRFAHASNIAFKDCIVLDAYNAHMAEMGGVRGITVQGCTFKKYTQNKASLKKEAIQLDICNNETIMPGTVHDDALCSNVLITDNNFTNLYRAVGSHSAVVGRYYENINISGNTFSDIKGKAINAYNFKNCTINNNTFTNCCEAIDFRAMSMNKQYSGSFYAPAKGGAPKAGKLNANLVISGNKITKDKISSHEKPDAAIRIWGAKVDKAYYSNGRLAVPKGDYYVENVRIENNSISAKANGVALGDVRKSTLKNNTIQNCGKSGIQMTDRCKVTVSGGKIRKNSKNGILVEREAEATVKGSKIEKNSSNGVIASNGRINISNKCTISGNKGHGVIFSGKSKGTVKNNTILNNKKSGIAANNGTISIEKNRIEGNKESGISLFSKVKATSVKNNILSNKGVNEILVGGGAKAPVQTAISLKADAVKSFSNTITGTAHPNMKLTAKVGSKTIGSTTVEFNGKYSMSIKKQKKNTNITVFVKDSKGNKLQRKVKVG